MRQYKEMLQASNATPSAPHTAPARSSMWSSNSPQTFERNKSEPLFSENQRKTAFQKYPQTGIALSPGLRLNQAPSSHFSPVGEVPVTLKQKSFNLDTQNHNAKLSKAVSENGINARQLTGDSLSRKPLHSWISSPAISMKKSVLNLLGVTEPKATYPGLPNRGQQTCFINSVLQCVGHIHGLNESMMEEFPALQCSQKEKDLVLASADLLQQLGSVSDSSTPE